MRMLRSILLLSLVTSLSQAQRPALPPSDDYIMKTWTVDDGLPESSPTSIVQTPDGYLWVGTWNGLARFDGLRFESFHSGNTPAFRVSRINRLFVDREGVLWISTAGGGLIRHRNGEFRRLDESDGLTEGIVTVCTQDANGTLWVGTEDGVFRIDGDRCVRPRWTDPDLDGDIADIDPDPSGSLWICKDERVLSVSTTGDSVRVIDVVKGAGVVRDSRGRIWISERSSVHRRRDPSGDAVFPQFQQYSFGSSWPLSDGGIGLCFIDRIILIRESGITQITQIQGVPLRANEVLFEDREGNIWLGRASSGLARIRKKSLTILSPAQGLSSEIIASVMDDPSGKLLVGTYRSGLNIGTNKSFTTLDVRGVESWSTVNLLWRDPNGTMWVGPTAGGLIRLIDGRSERYARGLVDSRTSVSAITNDQTGGRWIATRWNGLQYEANGRITLWDTGSGLSSNEITALLHTGSGDLWVGTSFRGVNRIRGADVMSLTMDEGLTSNEIRSIIEGEDGAVWFTTRRGLNRWKNGRVSGLGEGDGLADEAVSSMIDDGRGNYWFGGVKGIFRTRKSDLEALADGTLSTIRCRTLSTEDGLVVPEVGGGGNPLVWKDRAGVLWFTSERGLIRVDPSTVEVNLVPPPVIVEEVLIDHATVPHHGEVVLRPEHSKVEFLYTGISFRSPGKVRFRYRMEGLETDWQQAGTRRFVQYTHLPPGEYTFRVTAANSDGVWNETGASLIVVVLPPFYASWWFIALVVLFIATSGPTAYFLRVRALKREQLRQQEFSRKLLERQEEERRRISRDLHDSLGQELLVLKHRIQSRLRGKRLAKDMLSLLNGLSETVSGAVTQVRQISHNLRPPELDRLGLTETLKAILERVRSAEVFELKGIVDDVDGRLSPADEINVVRILQETLNNAIKHAKASAVSVVIRSKEDAIELMIKDDGIGMRAPEGSSAGIGLADIHERSRLMNGTCTVESAAGSGTIVHIHLPVKGN